MTVAKDNLIWRMVGASEVGSTHQRSGLPNQDALGWLPATGVGSPVIIAVSDGHGSAKSFRSDKGAYFAVTSALDVLSSFLQSLPDELSRGDIQERIQQELPINIVKTWRQAVSEDLNINPINQTELTRMVNQDGDSALKISQHNNLLAYGATLLAVAATNNFMLFIQIGDGDILGVDALAETSRIFHHDARMMGNETTSLCMLAAEKEFQIKLLPPEEFPTLVLICTDGYNNSFPDNENFIKIGQDYFQMIRNYGLDEVANQLPGYLKFTSMKGSGDDITLGILKRDEYIGVDFGKRQEIKIQELSENLGNTITKSEFEQAIADEAKVNMEKYENLRAYFSETIGDVQAKLQDSVTELFRMEEKVLTLDNGLQTFNGEIIQFENSLRNSQSIVKDAVWQIESKLESAVKYLDERLQNSLLDEQEIRINTDQAIQTKIEGLEREKKEILDRLSVLENNLKMLNGNLTESITNLDQILQTISERQIGQNQQVRWLQKGLGLAAFFILLTILALIIYGIWKS